MRSAYGREMRAKKMLEEASFKCFVPLHRVREERNGKITTKVVPVVRNLIFVHTTREALDPWKRYNEEGAALRYTIDKSTQKPMVVTDKAMSDFIRVTKESDDSLIYLDNPDVVVTKGQRVEIIVGPFKGIQGHVVRIHRDRRVVVSIKGLVAVAMASMPQSHFRLLKE